MFKKFVLVAAILAVAVVMPAKAQKLTKSKFRNLEIQAPFVDCSGKACVKGDAGFWLRRTSISFDDVSRVEESYSLGAFDSLSTKRVTITGRYEAMDVVTLITNLASEKSREPNFNYMSIEQVKDAKIGKQNAKLLTYSNSYLNEPFVGGIYGFVKDGYTYTVEYYGEDNPADVKLIDKIIQTIRVDVPVIDPTIVEKEEYFAPKEAKTQEEVAAQSQKEQEKIAKEQKKAEKERKDEIKKQEQAAKDAKKAQKEQEKELKKQKAAAKQALKEKEEAVKQQEKAIKEQKKAIKEKEKIEKQQQKEAKKVMKEQKAALENQIDMIDQEEKAFKEEKKLITEPTKEQKKIWKEKEKSLKDRKDAIKRQIKAL